jgi:hypothetical protein
LSTRVTMSALCKPHLVPAGAGTCNAAAPVPAVVCRTSLALLPGMNVSPLVPCRSRLAELASIVVDDCLFRW